MALKKRKLRKALFYILSKHLKENKGKYKRRKFWVRGLFRERKNKVHTTRRYGIYVVKIEKITSGL